MASGRHRFLRLMFVGFVLVQMVSVVYQVDGFSMVRKYELDNEYPSAQQLKDLFDYENAEEPLPPKAIPVKRQENEGGTCTCTCETRPVNDETEKDRAPPAQYPEAAGSLLRTGAGVRPQTASRVLERTHQQNPNTENKNSEYGDYHSKVAKGRPWNYYGMEPSKTEAVEDEEEEKSAQEEIEIKSTTSPEIFADDQHDAWGHNRRFPWKHLPNTMCFRESCSKDSDCCMRYNLCDKSAKVCVDCWYGSICKTEQDCCQRFPFCKRPTKPPTGARLEDLPNGKCVSKE